MYQVGSTCYYTALQAAQAAASSQLGAVVNHGGTLYTVDINTVSENAITYAFHPVQGGAPIISVSQFSAQPCGLLQLEDGLIFGWGVAAAFLAAFSLSFIARMLKGESTNGDT